VLNKFYNQKVAITGGAGLIGSFLVDHLVEAGAKVIVIDDFSKGSIKNLKHNFNNIEIRKGNLENTCFTKQALLDCKIVFHLASRAYGIGYEKGNQVDILLHNERITNNLIEAFKSSKPEHVLITSSSCVYSDEGPEQSKETEELIGIPEKANLSYGWSKRFLEQKMSIVPKNIIKNLYIVRPFNIYGERYKWQGEYSQAIPMILKKILDGNNPANIWGSGKQKRTYVHAYDCAFILTQIMEKEYTKTPVNIGYDNLLSIKELAETICKLSGLVTELSFDKTKPEGRFIKSADTTILKQVLGKKFEPTINFEEGIKRMLKWYETNFK
jgi:UDP-glucose 4-epimerase